MTTACPRCPADSAQGAGGAGARVAATLQTVGGGGSGLRVVACGVLRSSSFLQPGGLESSDSQDLMKLESLHLTAALRHR